MILKVKVNETLDAGSLPAHNNLHKMGLSAMSVLSWNFTRMKKFKMRFWIFNIMHICLDYLVFKRLIYVLDGK